MNSSFQVIHSVEDSLWPFMMSCLEEAFPLNERRSDQQMVLLLNEPSFSPYVLMVDNSAVGILNVWHLELFDYIEHFAMIPSMRGKGVGSFMLRQFLQQVDSRVVIEVEKPTSEQNKRRISFYEQHGFSLCPVDYVQPPYDQKKEAVPLLLMMFGTSSGSGVVDGEKIKQLLFQRVYQMNVPN